MALRHRDDAFYELPADRSLVYWRRPILWLMGLGALAFVIWWLATYQRPDERRAALPRKPAIAEIHDERVAMALRGTWSVDREATLSSGDFLPEVDAATRRQALEALSEVRSRATIGFFAQRAVVEQGEMRWPYRWWVHDARIHLADERAAVPLFNEILQFPHEAAFAIGTDTERYEIARLRLPAPGTLQIAWVEDQWLSYRRLPAEE